MIPGSPTNATATTGPSVAGVTPRARTGRVPPAAEPQRECLPLLSVVVPAYNEGAILKESLERLHRYLDSISDRCRWELVVVNDGSTDDTGAIAETVATVDPRIHVLHHRHNFNLGQALRYAFNRCDGDYVVTLDSDLSYDPSHIGRLLDAIRSTGAKIVIASPYAPGGRTTGVPFFRRLLSRSANRFLSLMAGRRLATLTGMARIYDRPFLSVLDLCSTDVGINTEIIYKAQVLRARVLEIPAHLDWTSQVDSGRRSSLRITRSVMTYVSSGFLFRPFVAFLLPGLVLLLTSLYTLAWAGYRTIEHLADPGTRYLSEAISAAYADAPHTFLVGGISMLLAVQLLSLGILAAQSKTYFEESFHLGTTLLREARGGPWHAARPQPYDLHRRSDADDLDGLSVGAEGNGPAR